MRNTCAYAKQRQISVASAGSGSSNHLAIELLMRMGNLNLLHVPYKGSGPALTDLLGSQVESMMDQLTASIGHIREGRIKPIAISSLKRSPLLPNVPTLDEAGVKGYEATTFTGIFAPAGTPQNVVDKLHGALRKALTQRARCASATATWASRSWTSARRSSPTTCAPTTTSGGRWRARATSSSSERRRARLRSLMKERSMKAPALLAFILLAVFRRRRSRSRRSKRSASRRR